MANAIIYCRVSTKEQVEEGHSLETQERICREYAERKEFKLLREPFVEEGESAKTTARPVLQDLLRYCTKNYKNIDAIIVYKIDRLSRNTDDYGQLRLLFDKLNIRIVSTSENFSKDPVGRFIENTLANVSELDNAIRAERCVNGSIELINKGMRNGRPPVGLRKIGTGKDRLIVKVEPQANLIFRAFELLDTQSYSEMEVYRKVIDEGLMHYSGKPIAFVYFDKMIRNPIYKGFLTDFGQNIESKLIEKVVSPELFDRVQGFLDGKKKKMPKYLKNNPDFPMRGMIRCERCGEKLSGSFNKGNGGLFPNYSKRCKCEFKDKIFGRDQIHARFAEYLTDFEYDENLINALVVAIKKNWHKRNEYIIQKRESISKEISDLDDKKQKIGDKILANPEQEEFWNDQLNRTINEQKTLRSELDTIVDPEESSDQVVKFAMQYLKQLSSNWSNQKNLEIKQRFQNFFFPEGITVFQDGRFGTSVLPLCMRIKSLYATQNYTLVDLMHFHLNRCSIG
ncbi:MAG: putative DNA-invertase from lambdoid prophage Rac [bacterium ADurb.Bin212]|nr:MAG: putative DNA-invertase from lambdoid prophage Rac [bacterium ADurb.Bin212]